MRSVQDPILNCNSKITVTLKTERFLRCCTQIHLTKFGLNWYEAINSLYLLYSYTIYHKYWNISWQKFIDLDSPCFILYVHSIAFLLLNKKLQNSKVHWALRYSTVRLWTRSIWFHVDDGELGTCLLPWLSPKSCYW